MASGHYGMKSVKLHFCEAVRGVMVLRVDVCGTRELRHAMWFGPCRHSQGLVPNALTQSCGVKSTLTKVRSVLRAVNGRDNGRYAEPGRDYGIPADGTSFSIKEAQLASRARTLIDWDDEDLDEKGQAAREKIGSEGEDPYRILEYGRKVYLDELDVLTLLDPRSVLIPTNADIYDQAAYLWKKIGDIPEERRHRLLDLLTPKDVANMWDISGQIYLHPNHPRMEPSNVLLGSQSEFFMKPVTWKGRAYNVPWPLSWFSTFQKAFFLAPDGSVYGRVITGGPLLKGITECLFPLYFEVRETRRVVATEETCHIAFEYGDGLLQHLKDLPLNFPKPAKHPWPFSDASYDYIRPVGPGVCVGQWWIEGRDLEQVPQKRLDFVIVKDNISQVCRAT